MSQVGLVDKALACRPRGHEFESCCIQVNSFAFFLLKLRPMRQKKILDPMVSFLNHLSSKKIYASFKKITIENFVNMDFHMMLKTLELPKYQAERNLIPMIIQYKYPKFSLLKVRYFDLSFCAALYHFSFLLDQF